MLDVAFDILMLNHYESWSFSQKLLIYNNDVTAMFIDDPSLINFRKWVIYQSIARRRLGVAWPGPFVEESMCSMIALLTSLRKTDSSSWECESTRRATFPRSASQVGRPRHWPAIHDRPMHRVSQALCLYPARPRASVVHCPLPWVSHLARPITNFKHSRVGGLVTFCCKKCFEVQTTSV